MKLILSPNYGDLPIIELNGRNPYFIAKQLREKLWKDQLEFEEDYNVQRVLLIKDFLTVLEEGKKLTANEICQKYNYYFGTDYSMVEDE